MIYIEFREKPLVNRIDARADLAGALARVAGSEDSVVLDLGSNVATTSWVDGFLVPFSLEIGARLTVVAMSDVSRAHIARVFRARGASVAVARTEADARSGAAEHIPAA
jgi:hypothetical protein